MHPDFDRPVYCLLGLPIDAIGEAEAITEIRARARDKRRCFLSTPNLNFAVASLRDASFRDSVLHSDLNTADGMPLVWIARLLGVPVRQRVAGSAVFEGLRAGDASPALRVYFFGGPDGAGAAACERLNGEAGGLRCVGFESPGFGDVEAMSRPEQIERINDSGADIVIVSLGARKGQAWIERNRERIVAPVITHLGAVVNFVAGSVRRAPRFMQVTGLEWLWRIGQEPSLWRRYWADGGVLIKLMVRFVIPYAVHLRTSRPTAAQLAGAAVERIERGPDTMLRLRGAWCSSNLDALRDAFRAAGAARGGIHLDMQAVDALDNAAIAQLCLLRGACSAASRGWSVSGVRPGLQRVLRWACAEYLVQPTSPALAMVPEEQAAC